MTTGSKDTAETGARLRSVADLPLFPELDAPDFGADLDWVATELFQRQYQGLYQHPEYGVIVCRNADLMALGLNEDVSHPAYFAGAEAAWGRFAKSSTFLMQPPEHRPAKAILNRQLSHKSMERFADTAEAVVRERLKLVEGRDAFDLVDEFVRPMLAKLWESVLGLTPAETSRIAEIVQQINRTFRIAPTEDEMAVGAIAGDAYVDVLTEALEREIARETRPILIDLMHDYAQMAGEVGRPENIAAHFGVGFGDAFGTAGGGASAALASLLASPVSYSAVKADKNEIESAISEGARINPPVLGTSRSALKDIVHDGVAIPADTPITMLWALGNRDPDLFDQPNEYRLERENRARQTTFGLGFYACPGRHTAKLVAKKLLTVLCDPDLEVTLLEEPLVTAGSFFRDPERVMLSVRRVGR